MAGLADGFEKSGGAHRAGARVSADAAAVYERLGKSDVSRDVWHDAGEEFAKAAENYAKASLQHRIEERGDDAVRDERAAQSMREEAADAFERSGDLVRSAKVREEAGAEYVRMAALAEDAGDGDAETCHASAAEAFAAAAQLHRDVAKVHRFRAKALRQAERVARTRIETEKARDELRKAADSAARAAEQDALSVGEDALRVLPGDEAPRPKSAKRRGAR
jgi:tetratricopeptide (TPR) repeat protein